MVLKLMLLVVDCYLLWLLADGTWGCQELLLADGSFQWLLLAIDNFSACCLLFIEHCEWLLVDAVTI